MTSFPLSRVLGLVSGAVVSLPNSVLDRLPIDRPEIDGQRLSPRLQLATDAARQLIAVVDRRPGPLTRYVANVATAATSFRYQRAVPCRDIEIAAQDRTISARLYEPSDVAEPAPLVVFVHGGGFIFGNLESHDGPCAYLAANAKVKVLSVDYRLAPESPFPAGFEDALAAYRWGIQHADEISVDRDRVAVAGDSAGGSIAAAVALHVGDTSDAAKLAVLLYPYVDDDIDRYPSTNLFTAPLSRASLDKARRQYTPDLASRSDPRAFVMRSEELSAMPCTYIAVAGVDVLRDQDEAFGSRLGDRVVVRRFDNLPHGFLNLLFDAEVRRAVDEIATYIAEHL